MRETRSREVQWVTLLRGWDAGSRNCKRKAKKLGKRGIPDSTRAIAWQTVSGAASFRAQHTPLTYQVSRGRCRAEIPNIQ